MASILLSNLNFFSVGRIGKGGYEAESGNEYCEIVDNMVKNLTQGR